MADDAKKRLTRTNRAANNHYYETIADELHAQAHAYDLLGDKPEDDPTPYIFDGERDVTEAAEDPDMGYIDNLGGELDGEES